MPRNDARRSRFLEPAAELGQHRADFRRRRLSRVSISSIEFAQFSLNLFQWVINFDAFHANKKVSGSGRANTASSDGVAIEDPLISVGGVMAVKAKPILFRQIRRVEHAP